jgi:hypothetical protein
VRERAQSWRGGSRLMSGVGERPRPQRTDGHRRVRIIVAIPVVILCGALGAVAGVLFPLHPPAVSPQPASAQPELANGAGPPVVRVRKGAAQPEAVTREVSPATLAAPSAAALAPDEPLAAAPQSKQASETKEEPPGSRHRRFARFVRAKRGQHARQRNRAVAGEAGLAKAPKGSLSQLPIIGPVTGLLSP